MLDYAISRLFLSTGSSFSSIYNAQYDDLLQDEYTLGPSGTSLVVEMNEFINLQLQSSSLLEALQSSRILSFLAPWSHVVIYHQPHLHQHVYTRKSSPTLRIQVILPLDGSAAAAVSNCLGSVQEFSSSISDFLWYTNVVCGTTTTTPRLRRGMFARHSSKDYSRVTNDSTQHVDGYTIVLSNTRQ